MAELRHNDDLVLEFLHKMAHRVEVVKECLYNRWLSQVSLALHSSIDI